MICSVAQTQLGLLLKLGPGKKTLLQLLEERVRRGHDVERDGDLEPAVAEVFHLDLGCRDADAHPSHGLNHGAAYRR